ncbi:hypothetical protein ED312_00020 [Sinomicrobium pectinilyticum]|uniref:Ig-like domain-containing protein n=1 Tax=Sinomicrobium pectinilyticum TaxID=1084421 RepID=A0A3N0F6G0_SINP1|nr:hypothetical protein [Sinomicrobium pectinilyticum]RNL95753.1 hypothetical protein ED312_00020 [Sinomicrobium pectinilyticum]
MYLTTTPHINGLGFILAVFFITGGLVPLWSQQPQERVYADAQTNNDCALCLTIDVANEGRAVDGDKDTYSTLSITVLGQVWQKLDFTSQQPGPDDPVHVKIGTSTGLASLATSLKFQAYNGNTPVGVEVALGSLIGLLNGADQADIVLPAPDVPYNSVRVLYDGVALGGGINIYGAYFNEPGDSIACDMAEDILWGSEASLAGGVNAVNNPQNAIDGDESTFAELNATVSVEGKTYVTALYPSVSVAGDSVRLVFRNPGGLIDLGLLSSSFVLRTYLDNQDNGALDLDSDILRLSLLSGSSDIQVLTFPVQTPFNRIEVAIGEGLATALASLHVYEIQRIAKGPGITSPQMTEGVVYSCFGDEVTLNIDQPLAGSVYTWYTAPTGGAPVATGTSYIPDTTVPGSAFFYASETREGCTNESGRTPVELIVFPAYGNPDIVIGNTTN